MYVDRRPMAFDTTQSGKTVLEHMEPSGTGFREGTLG